MGYPSCDTGLCRVPPNRSDPHGYYAALGVPPWSDADQIRAAARRLYRRLHPDTAAAPDPDRLQRVKLIADVLLDPRERERYDRTPPGKRLLDPVYRAELSSLGILAGMTSDEVERTLSPEPAQNRVTAAGHYDYLSVDRHPADEDCAQRWYRSLVAAAPLVGYRKRIKVLIHDGPSFFHPPALVMAVPRLWTPSTGLAFALFIVVAEMSACPARHHRHRRVE